MFQVYRNAGKVVTVQGLSDGLRIRYEIGRYLVRQIFPAYLSESIIRNIYRFLYGE